MKWIIDDSNETAYSFEGTVVLWDVYVYEDILFMMQMNSANE